jgi:esterase/lipase
MAHSSQNYFSGRMQEFIEGIYLRGQESEAAPVETIDKVPIFYVAGKKDDHCNYDTTKYFFKEVIQSSKRLLKHGKLTH